MEKHVRGPQREWPGRLAGPRGSGGKGWVIGRSSSRALRVGQWLVSGKLVGYGPLPSFRVAASGRVRSVSGDMTLGGMAAGRARLPRRPKRWRRGHAGQGRGPREACGRSVGSCDRHRFGPAWDAESVAPSRMALRPAGERRKSDGGCHWATIARPIARWAERGGVPGGRRMKRS
jgi:hypothetical protein